ncbi:hypothetical protein [Methylobacterium sp. WL19]|uniref:hypothetical protein n=1 Tax=Methylobacterium sp. WL19 TaxID=2603896 RepID=UPI0011C85D77|nr:hypothetical protein [Methylobacterium sp. WL19]TXN27402.1 hypothetical protein FV220_11610 [Methylobacterium sp. WL19]
MKSLEWAQRWTPELVREKGRAWFDEQEAKILVALDCRKRPPLPSADEVADALNITAGEVETYQMKTIGAVDRRKGVRVAEAKVKHAERQRDDRAASGATPRAESMAKTKPWEAHGMKRATYYRKVDKGELPPDPRMKKGPGKATPTGTVLRLVRSA